jgi:hypothetical protein
MANNAMLVTTSQLASRVKREQSRMIPTRPSAIRKLDGSAKKPSILDRAKNKR